MIHAKLAVTLAAGLAAGAAGNHYIITSVKQIKPSVVRQLRGARGPAGPRGSQGPYGIPGPPGLPGSSGSTESQTVLQTGTWTPAGGNEWYQQAVCPSGAFIFGGGYDLSADATDPFVVASDPVGNTWSVTVKDNSQPSTVDSVSAVCGL